MSRRISKSGVNSSDRSAGAETSLMAPISRSTRRPWLTEPLLNDRKWGQTLMAVGSEKRQSGKIGLAGIKGYSNSEPTAE